MFRSRSAASDGAVASLRGWLETYLGSGGRVLRARPRVGFSADSTVCWIATGPGIAVRDQARQIL